MQSSEEKVKCQSQKNSVELVWCVCCVQSIFNGHLSCRFTLDEHVVTTSALFDVTPGVQIVPAAEISCDSVKVDFSDFIC